MRISPLAALTLAVMQQPLGLSVYYWISGEAATPQPSELERLRPWRIRAAQRLTTWLQRTAMRKVTWFVTGPERMRDYFVRTYGLTTSQIRVLYNDIDVSKYRAWRRVASKVERRERLGLPAEAPIVLYVGRISYLKGGGNLPDIAQRLAHLYPEALLVVVGAPLMANVSAKLSVQPNVRLVGAVPHEQTVDFYCASDVFILPSMSEGFPRVLLEAMALELPFVALDVGGVSDIVGPEQKGLVVPRGDVEALVATTVRLLRDPDLRRELGEEGLRRVELFDTPRIARMFAELVVADAFNPVRR